jgi:hypothetical protein
VQENAMSSLSPFRSPSARRQVALALLGLSLVACGARKPAKPPTRAAGPVHEQKSTVAERQSVAITVYNQNFGLVREIRDLDLGTGRVSLEYRDVSAHIQPETVHIRSIASPDALNVLEQNYRYDLLSPQKLLEKYVGKKVKLYRWNEKTGRDEVTDAEILSVEGGQPVVRINGEVTYGYPGRFAFPKVPDNLIAKPTLVWLLGSSTAHQKVEVTYLTKNLSWSADYVLVINKDDTRGDLNGWVTLSNTSGTDYADAKLKLVAGDVQRVAQVDTVLARAEAQAAEAPAPPQFKEEGFFEYHLYTLDRPTTLLDKEQKQVSLLEAHDIGIKKTLIFYGAARYYRGRYGQVVSNQKVGVYLDIKNSKQNHMGMPLPKGTVRVYKADSSGQTEFIGEDNIDHTPRDEKIRVKMGDAFDVVGDRKQTDWKTYGMCTYETAWEIDLRNHKDKAEQVEVYEPIGGDWEILQSNHPAKKKDAHTFTFTVNVPANGKTKITYRVRLRWC